MVQGIPSSNFAKTFNFGVTERGLNITTTMQNGLKSRGFIATKAFEKGKESDLVKNLYNDMLANGYKDSDVTFISDVMNSYLPQ